jgi:hypothetical protein
MLANLKGKHAIYLVVEGPQVKQPELPQGRPFQRPQQPQRPKGLFTLHGIGFAAGDYKTPVVPQVTITVDGKKLLIPDTPVYSTEQNGLMDVNTYQTYAPLTAASKIVATATEGTYGKVAFEVSPVTAGRATVKATYNGKIKTFFVN